MDPSLKSGFQIPQILPNGQILNGPRPIIPIPLNPSVEMNEADDMTQPYNFNQAIERQDYQLNPNSVINPYKQNQKIQMLKPQTSDYGSPALQEHGKDYADYSTYFGINNIKCSKKKACLKSIKECNGCTKCDCVKRNQGKRCDCKCTKCENFKLCKVEKDCQKFCQCTNPINCKC